MTYYFAYGSNMDQKQMKERCPNSKLIGKGVLNEYKLAFTIYSQKRRCGCADIVASPNKEVWGLIYSLTAADLIKLDRFERTPDNYRRIHLEIEDESGNKLKVETYEVVNKTTTDLKPSKDYLSKITKATKEFSFPDSYKKMLETIETVD